MLLIITVLTTAKAMSPASGRVVDSVVDFFAPVRDWVARWMPVFFVPSLIVLPKATAGISTAQVAKVAQVTAAGWLLSLLFAAVLVRAIRGAAHSGITAQEEAATKAAPLSPFTLQHYLFWGALSVGALCAAPLLPRYSSALGSLFLLASTVLGYLLGVALPAAVKVVLHPLVVCTLSGNVACALWGAVTDVSYHNVLSFFVQQAPAGFGAGNALMAMLAVVVLCDGMRVYLQRAVVRRHAPEILGTVVASSLFSLFATAKLAAAVGMTPLLARSMLPRSITVALALPMCDAVGGSASLTAGMVCVTGLIGAAFGQAAMNVLRVRDEISRGVAQAASAHGLGTSAMAAAEPQALPFCAVTIAVMGTVSNLLLAVPAVRGALLAITG